MIFGIGGLVKVVVDGCPQSEVMRSGIASFVTILVDVQSLLTFFLIAFGFALKALSQVDTCLLAEVYGAGHDVPASQLSCFNHGAGSFL